MKIAYKEMKFSAWKLTLIEIANNIIKDYKQQGYEMTLRQLYYQFVSRDLLPERWIDEATGSTNNERSYKNLGELINDARMAGLISWHAINDLTRNLRSNSHWTSPAEIIRAVANQYKIDKWENQPYRVEIWVEKDALQGVVARPASDLDVSYFSCRGYSSATAIHDAAMRLKNYIENSQKVVILHLGDHDPSGIDMTRDIEERMNLFLGNDSSEFELRRLGLNMDQIKRYAPPPNPAKITDSRAIGYIEKYGKKSWELDALEPSIINKLITDQVIKLRSASHLTRRMYKENIEKSLLASTSKHWDQVADFVETLSTE